MIVVHENRYLLFGRGDARRVLHAELEKRRDAVRAEVLGWDSEQLVSGVRHEVIDDLVASHLGFECPRLHRDRAEQLPASEVERDGVRRTQVVVAVPFDGDERVFALQPSVSSPRAVRGFVQSRDLCLVWEGAERDPPGIRQYFDAELDEIESCLASSRHDIEAYNDSLREFVAGVIAERQADWRFSADVGFPVRRRPEAGKYSVPVKRRQIVPRRPAPQGGFHLEPRLADADYEAVLEVLRSGRNALERSPSMTAVLDENKIRDLLLFFLNGQFEGRAAGEVFNGAGRTDILVRVEDRNVFIAECKIWRGPKTISGALDQLLSYLVWRDTKAALLVFIRDGGVTSIIRKAVTEIKGHPNCKRIAREAGDRERYDFVFQAGNDPEREIALAFMPFALGNPGPER